MIVTYIFIQFTKSVLNFIVFIQSHSSIDHIFINFSSLDPLTIIEPNFKKL